MNFKVEHAIIAVLVLALLYYVYKHNSFVGDVSPLLKHPKVKEIAESHFGCTGCTGKYDGTPCHCRTGSCISQLCMTY